MNSSIKVLSVRGIDIRIHVTFPLILLWVAFQFGILGNGGLPAALFGIVSVLFLFVLVTLHELGHSFAAQSYGVPVKQIVLLPIGGVAQLSHIPSKPIQEFVIAIAGPAVNVAIAAVMGATALAFSIPFANPLAGLSSFSLTTLFWYIFIYNIILAVFNMIPAFPMDGGRILRSLLAMRLEYSRATKIAVKIGQVLAVLFGIYGLFSGNLFTILIAFFIYNGAAQEGLLVQLRSQLKGYTVRQAYGQQVGVLAANDTLQRALTLRVGGLQMDFPVVHNGYYVGFLSDKQLMEALKTQGPETLVSDVMSPDVQPVALLDDLADVQERMSSERAQAFPVVHEGYVYGMITWRNIRELLKMVARRPDLYPRLQSV